MRIDFNRPYMTGQEEVYIREAMANHFLSGDGLFTKKCNSWIEGTLGVKKALITHSCTAALEMTAILADIKSGDEIIMPSYTFVSTANAFVLRGGVPVFIDIREDTLNIDENLIEQAITSRTKAIVVVHYAGVACEMDRIMEIADKHHLLVIEDAAQAIMSTYKGRNLGSIGHMATLSFHETKNVISGEGGAVLINDTRFIERAEIIREKGTNRSKFFRGETDKYTWVDIGSSFLPSEIIAGVLYAQLEKANQLVNMRKKIWWKYHENFSKYLLEKGIRLPVQPAGCQSNGHIYYLLMNRYEQREKFIHFLKGKGIHTVFHYVPLHSSPAGKKYGRCAGTLKVTDWAGDCLVRLPIWCGLEEHDFIIEKVMEFLHAGQ